MSPNQEQRQHDEPQQRKATMSTDANWELDRLSTTGRHFLLEPESRSGIVQDLQQRLQQEQWRRRELLLLWSTNNASQDPPQASQRQPDEGKPSDEEPPPAATTGEQTAPDSNTPSLVDRNDATRTDKIDETQPSFSEIPKTAEIHAYQTKSKQTSTANAESTPSVKSMISLPASVGRVVVPADDETTALARSSLNLDATGRKTSVTEAVFDLIRVKHSALTVAAVERRSSSEQAKRRKSQPSAPARPVVANEEAMANIIAPTSRRSKEHKGSLDSTTVSDENAPRPKSGSDLARSGRGSQERSGSFRSANPTTDEASAGVTQRTVRSSHLLSGGRGLHMEPARKNSEARNPTAAEPLRQTPNEEPGPGFHQMNWRADTRQHPSTANTAWPLAPSRPDPQQPQLIVPPCLQCLMRCLRISGLLGSYWKTAVFELEEAFAIKEVADAAVGKNGAGAGGESRQPLPLGGGGRGYDFSGGEGSTVTSEISKWQALERLCSLRNSLKACSHMSEN